MWLVNLMAQDGLCAIDQETHQARLAQHEQNACAHVKSTGLIYDAIQIAQQKQVNPWVWQHDQAEHHPAILKLCAFWTCYQGNNSQHEACIPYIQLFTGKETYVPIIQGAPIMSLRLDQPKMKQAIKQSSVILGEMFFITFLSGRHVTAGQSAHDFLVYYTVNNDPLLKERLLFGKKNLVAFDLQNQLAWQTLKALHEFPKRFPKQWEQLKKQHEANHYDMH